MSGKKSSLSKFTQTEISKLFRHAKRCVRSKGLDILLLPALESLGEVGSPQGRILVITPRRIGSAPQRNKIRRQFKALYHELGLTGRGYDCMVIVKPEGVGLAIEILRDLLLQAFEHAPEKPTAVSV